MSRKEDRLPCGRKEQSYNSDRNFFQVKKDGRRGPTAAHEAGKKKHGG
jgi:hypothetical protein